MIRAHVASLATIAVLIAGCSSNPNAASNQIWPIPQLDAAFGDPHQPAPPPEPLDAHRPGYLPAYPAYQPQLTESQPASPSEATGQPPEAQPYTTQSTEPPPPAPYAFQGPGGVPADDQPNATPPDDGSPPELSPPGTPQTHAAAGGGSGYVR
jgi:hypothetical protein